MIPVLVGLGAAKIIGGVFVGGVACAAADDALQSRYKKGYKDGYEAASRAYEAKYRRLIEEFESDKKKLRQEMNKYKQLCKELLAKCEEYERMGYSELADRAKDDYYRLRNAA